MKSEIVITPSRIGDGTIGFEVATQRALDWITSEGAKYSSTLHVYAKKHGSVPIKGDIWVSACFDIDEVAEHLANPNFDKTEDNGKTAKWSLENKLALRREFFDLPMPHLRTLAKYVTWFYHQRSEIEGGAVNCQLRFKSTTIDLNSPLMAGVSVNVGLMSKEELTALQVILKNKLVLVDVEEDRDVTVPSSLMAVFDDCVGRKK